MYNKVVYMPHVVAYAGFPRINQHGRCRCHEKSASQYHFNCHTIPPCFSLKLDIKCYGTRFMQRLLLILLDWIIDTPRLPA
jgi:hypothetical protein